MTFRTPAARRMRALAPMALAVFVAGAVWATSTAAATPATHPVRAAAARASADAGESAVSARVLDDSLFGRSGKLRARLARSGRTLRLPALERLFGDSAFHDPGVHALRDSSGRSLSLITLIPFEQKQRGRLGDYRMGFWPGERRAPRSPAYRNPEGFIRITRENQDTYVSEHFRLRDFLTHDQQGTWPKYLVLREELVDKLELIIQDMEAHGTPVEHMTVMSGFRTPQYNERGVGKGGRARDSRHQFGDAADVFVDNDGDGRMDDLNRDGRVDARDAQVIIDAAERVEARHPVLLGGAGRYRANSAHGPFAHIDVRGTRARWGNA